MNPRMLVPPPVEPVSLEEAKQHLRVELTDEDPLISNLIQTAREHAESFQNRSFITRTYELFLDIWPDTSFVLPMGPIQKIISVVCLDENGEEIQVNPDIYFLNSKGHIFLNKGEIWPDVVLRKTEGVKITYEAGYGSDSSRVPANVKQAILLMVAHWYLYRENVSEKPLYIVPLGAYLLLGIDRVWPL